MNKTMGAELFTNEEPLTMSRVLKDYGLQEEGMDETQKLISKSWDRAFTFDDCPKCGRYTPMMNVVVDVETGGILGFEMRALSPNLRNMKLCLICHTLLDKKVEWVAWAPNAE